MKWLKLFILSFIVFKAKTQPQTLSNINSRMVDSLINWIYIHPKVDSQYILTLHRISRRLSEKDTKQSFEYYEKVSLLSDSLNFTYGKALAEINLGLLLRISGNLEASNSAFLKAIDEAEACQALRLEAISLNNISENFETLNYYSKSREYLNKAIAINTQLNSDAGLAANYETLARCDLAEKLFSDVRNDLLKGMPFAVRSNDSYVLSQYYLAFGKLAAINNDTDSSKIFFLLAEQEAQLQNDLQNKCNIYLAWAQYVEHLSSVKKILLLKDALNIAHQTNYLEGIVSAAQQLSFVYDSLNNKSKSLLYYRMYRSAADSLFSQRNERNIVLKEAEWNINRKEVENQHLKNMAELQQKDISAKNKLLLVSIISILLFLMVAVFIYRSFQLKKKREESLLKQKLAEAEALSLRTQMNQLIKLEQIRSQIACDLHDDIGSSLSSIMVMSELAKRQGNTENYFGQIKETARKIIESMNDIVWAINPDNDTMEQLLIRMQRFAASLLEKKNIELDFNACTSLSSLKLTMEERKNLYLIFKETVHNAFKYAECNKVSAQIKQHSSDILMTIKDDGKGFDTALKFTGNGLKNILKRAEEIGGKLSLVSFLTEGTTMTLAFQPTCMCS